MWRQWFINESRYLLFLFLSVTRRHFHFDWDATQEITACLVVWLEILCGEASRQALRHVLTSIPRKLPTETADEEKWRRWFINESIYLHFFSLSVTTTLFYGVFWRYQSVLVLTTSTSSMQSVLHAQRSRIRRLTFWSKSTAIPHIVQVSYLYSHTILP